LDLDTTKVPTLAANSFTATQTINNGNLYLVGTTNGLVGIGTSAPDRKVQIVSSPGVNADLHIGGTGDEINDVFAGMGVNVVSGPAFNYGYSGHSFGRSSGFFNIRPDASAVYPNPSLRFMTANTQRMIITATGKVGIGTSDPQEALHVIGNVRVSGSIIYGAPEEPVPDYVFEPGYRLMPVEELQKYLAREKHLPNMPNAGEIREKGLKLGEYQMKLLEKIEELTLYTVQQAKTIREQQTALERKDGKIESLNARLAAVEQILERLAGQQDREQK
jgi:hypothetical protein